MEDNDKDCATLVQKDDDDELLLKYVISGDHELLYLDTLLAETYRM